MNRQQELDQVLRRLQGILSVYTVFTPDGQPSEIHVLSNLDRAPKQLVRDIQSAAQASLSLPIDYKIISIAQIDPVKAGIVCRDPRVILSRVSLVIDRRQVEAKVELRWQDRDLVGIWRSPLTEQGANHAAAQASLNALQALIGSRGAVFLRTVERQTIGGVACVIVSILLVERGTELFLFGIASVTNSDTEPQAAVKAVLSALNRKIGYCAEEQSPLASG